jgi:hypothetical protein
LNYEDLRGCRFSCFNAGKGVLTLFFFESSGGSIVALHDEVEEYKLMAGIGHQARPYKQRTSMLAEHSATIHELLFAEHLTLYQVWQFLCRRRGLRGIAYSTVRRFVIKQGWHQPEVKT